MIQRNNGYKLLGLLIITVSLRIASPHLWRNLGAVALIRGIAQGDALSCMGDPALLSQAETFLKRAAINDKNSYALLAKGYLWQGRLLQVGQAMRNSPYPLSCLIEQANSDQKKGYNACAFRQYEMLIQIVPDSSLPWYYMGDALASTKEYTQAQKAYDQAITLNNFQGDTVRLGDVYIQKGEAFRDDESIAAAYQAYSQATVTGEFSTSSQKAFAYQKQGEMLVWMGRYVEAVAPLQKALEIIPDFYNAYSLLGVIAYQQGNIEDAVQHWEKAIRIEPKYVWPYLHLARMYRDLEEPVKARTYYRQVLVLEPQNQTVLEELAELKE